MSVRWDDWVHAIISTCGSWLPGDPRGFRDHGHRIHSSGDHKDPSPARDHTGLYRIVKSRIATPIGFPPVLRAEVAGAFAEKLAEQGVTCRIIAIGDVHGHALVRVGKRDAKPIIGRAKQYASHRIRRELPGTVWAQGCNVVRIESEEHYRWVIEYIHDHEQEGAAIWVHSSRREDDCDRSARPGPSQSLRSGVPESHEPPVSGPPWLTTARCGDPDPMLSGLA